MKGLFESFVALFASFAALLGFIFVRDESKKYSEGSTIVPDESSAVLFGSKKNNLESFTSSRGFKMSHRGFIASKNGVNFARSPFKKYG
jgi:hypothetical protein